MAGEKRQNSIDSIIGGASIVHGIVKFSGGLRVDGSIFGNVESDPAGSGYLHLSSRGRIEGDVRVAHVVVGGEIIGNLYAADRVELQPCACITGDIFYSALAMQAGAAVSGKLWPAEGPMQRECPLGSIIQKLGISQQENEHE